MKVLRYYAEYYKEEMGESGPTLVSLGCRNFLVFEDGLSPMERAMRLATSIQSTACEVRLWRR